MGKKIKKPKIAKKQKLKKILRKPKIKIKIKEKEPAPYKGVFFSAPESDADDYIADGSVFFKF